MYQIYHRAESNGRPSLRVYMTDREADVYVANIVSDGGSISIEEYNTTLEDFTHGFVMPAAQSLNLAVHLGETYVDLSVELGEDTYRALRAFSRLANKSTGSAHPLDSERWMTFIWRLYRSRKRVQSDILKQWLILDGWSEHMANDLVSQFEFGTELLRHGQTV